MATDNAASARQSTSKHIFVTGGVVSSLGKGLTASSLGMLLRRRGLKVTMQKLDPYINVDPGTMNPFQHGEVFVTDDGAETDLDLGHYERFLDEPLTAKANVTTGQIYSAVIARERRGDYLGDTVQVIPHITDEIVYRMRAQADVAEVEARPDLIITEIGGTVGDIESTPFLEAARQVRQALGPENCVFIHVSLLPYLRPAAELKTKPTQHSVATLRGMGIQPDALVLRSEVEIPESTKRKLAAACGVEDRGVIACPDVDSLYQVPEVLHEEGLDAFVLHKLRMLASDVQWDGWQDLVVRATKPEREVEIALVGKYVGLPDAYLSVTESLRAAGMAENAKINVRWVEADTCAGPEETARALAGVDGVLVPGGFGVRGIEGKIQALQWARENRVPTLGICLGMQGMVIEAARNLAGLDGAHSAEFDPQSPAPVISVLESQKAVAEGEEDLGGTMRLGAYPAVLDPESVAAKWYGTTEVSERHRHRYEVNPEFTAVLEGAGLHVSGTSPDGTLAEFVELAPAEHPFYVGTQAHPEFKSRPTRPHPLFQGLVSTALAEQG